MILSTLSEKSNALHEENRFSGLLQSICTASWTAWTSQKYLKPFVWMRWGYSSCKKLILALGHLPDINNKMSHPSPGSGMALLVSLSLNLGSLIWLYSPQQYNQAEVSRGTGRLRRQSVVFIKLPGIHLQWQMPQSASDWSFTTDNRARDSSVNLFIMNSHFLL